MKSFEEYIPVDSEKNTIKEKSAFMKNQHMVVIPITSLNIAFINTKNETHATCLTSEGWKGFVFPVTFCLKNICLWVCVKSSTFTHKTVKFNQILGTLLYVDFLHYFDLNSIIKVPCN